MIIVNVLIVIIKFFKIINLRWLWPNGQPSCRKFECVFQLSRSSYYSQKPMIVLSDTDFLGATSLMNKIGFLQWQSSS